MKTRDIIVWVAAIIAFLTGIGPCIAGFIVPPAGVISGSVLTATIGEICQKKNFLNMS